MTKQEILLAHEQYLFPSVFHYFKEPLVIARAKDQFVWDADGNQYLDFFGGIVTISVGHSNETVTRKTAEQMERLQHVSTVFATEPQAALAKRIAEISPGGKLTKSFSPIAAPKRTKPRFSPPAATPEIMRSSRCATPITDVPPSRWPPPGKPPGVWAERRPPGSSTR